MRKVMPFAAAWFAALMLIISPVLAEFDSAVDYSELMVSAAASGDAEAGHTAARRRDEKIDSLGLDAAKIDYDELVLLAKIIHTEAGSSWLPDDWKMAVGEVVLNRVASPEFPNTIRECVYQSGQYSGVGGSWFEALIPYKSCVEAAKRLLQGERVLNEPSVVFQSGEVQGSGVFREMTDKCFGSTYFCYSNHPELYEA